MSLYSKEDVFMSWREMLAEAMTENEDPGPIVAMAPDDVAVWDRKFDSGAGLAEGAPVLAWTVGYVYFPVEGEYSVEKLGCAPRNPRPEGQSHV